MLVFGRWRRLSNAQPAPRRPSRRSDGATRLYAVYDPVSRQCALACAGHVLPAVVCLDGTADLLELPPGPPLGLGGLPFEAAEFDFPEGSVLALYTDGLIEGRDHDVEAGIALVRQALAQPAFSLQATCDTVLDALLPADRPHDDVALLLARTHVLGARHVASRYLDGHPVCVSRARSNVAQQLTSRVEKVEFSTGLIVSELVTNAIRYGRPPIRLRLIHDRALVCEVSDTSSTTPHLPAPGRSVRQALGNAARPTRQDSLGRAEREGVRWIPGMGFPVGATTDGALR
ncbi:MULTISPECIES: ATP-binding SpoIIE family protein phosphatase [Streptomyces]|uniref:ATP-binding SpoIIE family protein phosphatase n=1 Tax=Streptomyces TaxID=1883 RepID=UPI000AF634BF|nr:ATP-binding SpoIIE family protein phosphatase [Streptomyces sp. NRRL F-3307]